jgi:hypothetical protein
MKSSDLGQLGIDLEIVITAVQNTHKRKGLDPPDFPMEVVQDRVSSLLENLLLKMA